MPQEPIPSERELEILKALWELGPASVRDVHRKMCPGGELAFNTIQTMLRIMDEKEMVSHRAEGRTFIYTPLYQRERFVSRFLERVFDGSIDQLVLSLLRARDSDADELKRLELLIAEARERKTAGERPKKKGGR